ncbi:MAG: class I tRNA ligase family protein, partial [Methyloceanibacter sp.]
MAKSKSKKPLLRARSKRAAQPSAKAKAPVKKVKPAARGAKRPAAKAKVAKAKTARKPSARSAAARGAKAAKPASAKTKAKPVTGAQAKATSPLAVAKPRPPQIGRDWSKTLFLPKTDFPMKAGLPEREPELLKRWERLRLYDRLREEAMGREKFVLHDGPPYANSHIHIGTGLNKILKDVVTRSQSMMGKDANYVPGWDCHGLPIEWKIEEENYRAKGKTKPDLSDPAAMIAFRRECRAYAQHWLDVQREEFKRLGIEGDWDHPYTTMSFDAEATIAAELMKFAMNGLLYRGSKPVMWSVVERTALAEAEVEYQEITSHTIFVKFPLKSVVTGTHHPRAAEEREAFAEMLTEASVVIWTTTPWTIPGNRAISYSNAINYGLYEVTGAPEGNWAKRGDKLVIADALAENLKTAARIESWDRLSDVKGEILRYSIGAHPLRGRGYDFDVPLLAGEHVTADTGTGFVHTAPGHGREDFEVWTANERLLADRKIDPLIPFAVDGDGYFTKEAPGFESKRVIDDKGNFGDANEAVIKALIDANA